MITPILNKFIRQIQRNLLGTITHVLTTEPLLALTFDDGPHPLYTKATLEVLARYDARATFFMVGEAARERLDLVQKVLKAGHAIGNHSWDHSSFPELKWQARRNQILTWEREVGKQLVPIFRPPWGQQNTSSRLTLLRSGYQVITWNVALEDWLWQEPEDLAIRLIQSVKPGCIILLHDAIYKSKQDPPQYDRRYMIGGLNIALSALSQRFRFVTVPELLASGRPVRKIWIRDGIA